MLQIELAIERIIKRCGTSLPQDVGVASMPYSQINHLLTFSCTPLLGAFFPRQRCGEKMVFFFYLCCVWEKMAWSVTTGLFPSLCARRCLFVFVSLTS
jgi:hypothetical protein